MKKLKLILPLLLLISIAYGQRTVIGDPPLNIIVSTTNPTSCGGNDGAITVTPNLTPAYYQWSNGAVVGNLTNLPAGTYSVTVTSPATICRATETVNLVGIPAPTITQQTQSQVLCAGEPLTLSIVAIGTNLTYQWRKNGTPIPGANSAIYTIASTTPSDAGSYQCIVTSGNCQVSSNLAQVTVKPAPVVNIPNVAIAYPASATLTATGGGSYLWSTGATTASITVNPASTTTYTVTVIGTNGCASTDDVTVTVTGGPLVVNQVIANPSGPICRGRSVTLSAVISNGVPAYTYVWSNGATGANITVTPQVTTTYTVTVTDHYNATATGSVTVIVNNPPVANAGADQIITWGDSTMIGTPALPGHTYQWAGPNGFTSTLANPIVAPTRTSTYTLTVSNGCSSTDDVTVQVIGGPFEWTNPTAPITSSLGTTINLGQSTTLTASVTGGTPPYTYLWNTGATTASITVNPISTTTYSITVNDASRAQLTGSITINVVVPDPPTATVGYNTQNKTICEGESTFFAITISGGVKPWSVTYKEGQNNVVINNITSSPYNITVSPNTTTSYLLVSVTDSLGQVGSATGGLTVTVNPAPPQINLGQDQTICQGSSTTLSDINGNTYTYYQWSNGATTASITVSPTTTTTYIVTATNAFMCSKMDTIKVTVNQLPNINAGPNFSICLGESAILTATGGTSYSWNPGGMLGASITVSPTTTTTYTVIGGANGCFNSDQVTVYVNPIPLANAGPDLTICEGNSASLTATVSPGNSYTWSNGAQGPNIVVSPISTTVYTLTVTSQAGCKATDAVTVIVAPLPTINAGPDRNICAGTSVTLNPTVTGGPVTFLWSPATGLDDPTNETPIATPMVSTTYQVQVTTPAGCMAMDQITIVVNPLPVVTANDGFVCEGSTLQLIAGANIQGCSFTWTPSTGLTNPNTNTPIFNGDVTTTYVVIATSPAGCIGTKTVTVTVNPKPVASFTATVLPDFSGKVQFTNTSQNATSYLWDFGDGTTSIQMNPLHTYTVNGSFNVWLTATNSCGSHKVNQIISGVYIGIDDLPFETSTLNIYPNPAEDIVTIAGIENVTHLRVLDMKGGKIYEKSLSKEESIQLDVSNFTSGIYNINFITSNGNIFSVKLIKKGYFFGLLYTSRPFFIKKFFRVSKKKDITKPTKNQYNEANYLANI